VGLARSGESVGGYRLLGEIGSGGMGVVFVAEHLLLGRRAAIKFLHPHISREPEMVERFFNEARAASAVKHPGIVEVYDFGYWEGIAYLVMEYLDGESLLSRLRVEASLPVARTLAISRKVVSALVAAHEGGVVHRDLKPDNIFLVRPPPEALLSSSDAEDQGRVCLLDFGVAKLLPADGSFSASATASGVLVGTPTFMSPEQAKGGGHVDRRSDLYSLGCVMYGMLCGRPPFIGQGGGDVLAHHIFVAPEPPSAHAPQVPPALDAIVLKLLEKEPDRRFQSARELGVALREMAESDEAMDPTVALEVVAPPGEHEVTPPVALAPLLEPTSVTPLAWLSRAPRWFLHDWRIWMPVAGAGVLLLLLAISLGGTGRSSTAPAVPAPPPGPPAAAAAEPQPTVEIVITSIPPGAEVMDQASGQRLGRSPFRVRRPPASGHSTFVLVKDGFEAETVSVRSDVSSEAQVVLAALPEPAVPAIAPARSKPPRPIRRERGDPPPAEKPAEKPAGGDKVGDGALDPFEK
jgi:serine/threonine protein kinase